MHTLSTPVGTARPACPRLQAGAMTRPLQQSFSDIKAARASVVLQYMPFSFYFRKY